MKDWMIDQAKKYLTKKGSKAPMPKRIRKWSDAERGEILAKIEELRPWYYSFDFGQGITTRQGQDPRGKFVKVLRYIPEDLSGNSCLDIPCSNAQMAMFLKDRGADRVLGIELVENCVRQGKYITGLLGYDVELLVNNIHSVPDGFGKFDYVFCLGLMYHLKDMVGAMNKLYSWTNKVCFVETEVLRVGQYDTNAAMFIEGRYFSDATNWWIPGIGCVMGMARSAGFKEVEVVDYWEHGNKVSREGIPMQARGIFRMTVGEDRLLAPRKVIK